MIPAIIADFASDHYVWFITGFSLGACLVLLRRHFQGGVCHSKARLDGKTVVITGANTGIGKETARDLARRGARVILGCRDTEKGEQAAVEIRKATGNGNVVVRHLDLASLASVRSFANGITQEELRLDVLINNAGIMHCPKWETKEGYEMQFGTNHLGHFLLTNLLLDLLTASAPSRVVNVSSLGHKGGEIHFDDINLDKDYNPWKAYSQSKLANVLFTRELARRLEGTGVTTNSLHPGLVRTDLGRHMYKAMPHWRQYISWPLILLIFKTSDQGAQTSIHCAVSEDLANTSGLYFSDCKPKDPAPQGQDDQAARRLWQLSEEMTGLA